MKATQSMWLITWKISDSLYYFLALSCDFDNLLFFLYKLRFMRAINIKTDFLENIRKALILAPFTRPDECFGDWKLSSLLSRMKWPRPKHKTKQKEKSRMELSSVRNYLIYFSYLACKLQYSCSLLLCCEFLLFWIFSLIKVFWVNMVNWKF